MSELQDVILSNRYNLIEKIGEGGMALVYKAKDLLLNRYVAVKILRPEFTTDPEFINKFKRESLAAASLSHPNIVGIYDVGEQEGINYIVMEYVCGKTLKEYIRECRRINYREALNIANQIGNALEHAHKNGVVHRDIKPHNILVTEDKIIKVTDFGIAKASNVSTIINTGSVMGSVHYFSPEQARGNYSDHRTDIYSLGVVLYEMLTGSLPYDAESPVTVALKHIQEEFIQPTIVVNTIPEAINDIVVKAMEKDMNKRYQSIKELIDDIEIARNNPYQRIMRDDDERQMTQKISTDEIDKALINSNRTKKKRSKKLTIILSTVSVLLIGVIIGGVYFFNNHFFPKNVTIPQIIGLNEDVAKNKLKEYNLVGVEGPKQNRPEPEGQVVNVSPPENSVVKEKSVVTLYVSKGVEKVTVPDITNKSEADAKLILDDYNLKQGTVDHLHDYRVPKGQIISQVPTPGESIDAGSKVSYTISDGPIPKMLTVPELTGKTKEEALKALRVAGITNWRIVYEPNENFENDVVLAQSIDPYTQISENKTLEIQINKTNPTDQQNQTNTTPTGIQPKASDPSLTTP